MKRQKKAAKKLSSASPMDLEAIPGSTHGVDETPDNANNADATDGTTTKKKKLNPKVSYKKINYSITHRNGPRAVHG